MNDHACILIWDAHTRMGHNIGPYAYGISHAYTRMGRPIRRGMGQYTHMGQNMHLFCPICVYWPMHTRMGKYYTAQLNCRRAYSYTKLVSRVCTSILT